VCVLILIILSSRYLRAAKAGDEIVIDANTLKLGKSLAFLSIEIKNKKDGKLVAVGSHTKFVGASSK